MSSRHREKKKGKKNTTNEWKPATAAKSREKRSSAESCSIGDVSEAKCPLPRLQTDEKRQISLSFVCLSDFSCPLSVPVSLTLCVAHTDGKSRAKRSLVVSANKKKLMKTDFFLFFCVVLDLIKRDIWNSFHDYG